MIHAHRGDISGLVGAIYDCAHDRGRWPDALRQICKAPDCVAGELCVLNLDTGECGFAVAWGGPPETTRMFLEPSQGRSGDWQSQALIARPAGTDLDEPFVLRRLPHAEALKDSGCFRPDCAVE
jgi:hypothetical protein